MGQVTLYMDDETLGHMRAAAAGVRARLETEGTPMGPMDILIAGTALAHRGVLVTRNVREFGRAGLAVENGYGDSP